MSGRALPVGAERIQGLLDGLQQTASLPADRPMGLHGAYYTSPDLFELEKATVLRAGWHCLGRADEIPQAGDYFAARLLDEPLIVIRGDDAVIRVFANVCRHRGMLLAEGRGNVKRLVCSYHAWSYGRDGALLRAAHMENAGFDRTNCRLAGFACELWQGFIYVSLSENPEPLAAALAPLAEVLAPYDTVSFRIVHSAEEDWQCNWKCLVENFMEGYHLSVVHPKTLRGYTPTELCTKGPSSAAFTSYNANYPDGIPSRGKGAPGLDAGQRQRSFLFNVFPTQVASQAASLLASLSLQPVSVGCVHVRWTLSVYGDDLDDETIAQRIALWTEVNREDREKLEKLQLALGSSRADAGPLAAENFEGTIRDFHLYLAGALAPVAAV
ncbi:aromatic ring-hydroxylating dioxygenase subunit alpha [Ruegeria sp. XHP0148]|uniref:Aromatic ring-hydroxylating dioxygenase subunit alpha n=2 Tax=Ruegeria aquimaris TaxID=2984333 RepID=A0ABT3AHY4_9RHOB|nr:aromatic ring-hydroxylating dioxygenase subunit alpha [Ruegeria sp. XHP0148]